MSISEERLRKRQKSSHESNQVQRQHARREKLNSIMAMKGRKGQQKGTSRVRPSSSG